MNKIVIASILLMAAYINVAAASVMYGSAYEAIDGISRIGIMRRGQFDDIDARVQKWCNENGLYAQCLYLDKIGGQKLIKPDIEVTAHKWINAVYPQLPKYYKTKIVQSIDAKGRKVQDHFLKRCERVREIFEYASTQSILLGFDDKTREGLECAARKFTTSIDWKLLSDKQSKTGVKGAIGLMTIIREELLPEIEKSLVQVLIRKQESQQEFLLKNPAAANAAINLVEMKRLKDRATRAEAAAEEAKRQAWVADMDAEDARNEAARARDEAARARDNASRANAKLRDNGTW